MKSIGRPSLLLRLGERLCVCVRHARMDKGLKDRVRPLVFGGYACWCDRRGPG